MCLIDFPEKNLICFVINKIILDKFTSKNNKICGILDCGSYPDEKKKACECWKQ